MKKDNKNAEEIEKDKGKDAEGIEKGSRMKWKEHQV